MIIQMECVMNTKQRHICEPFLCDNKISKLNYGMRAQTYNNTYASNIVNIVAYILFYKQFMIEYMKGTRKVETCKSGSTYAWKGL